MHSPDDPPPIPPSIEAAYDHVRRACEDREDGLPHEDARDLLVEAEYDPADADHAIQRLIEEGYLYRVSDRLYVTDPDA